MKIYASRRHLWVTMGIIAAPFLFLLAFAEFYRVNVRDLYQDVFVSSFRLALAYLIAALLGWVLAASFYRGRRAAIALPVFDVLQSFPTFAALPLATLYFGVSSTTVVLFLILTVIWPIFFSIVSSLKLIRRDWEEAVTVARLSGLDYLRMFLIPATIPGFVTGSVIGLGEGWEALVATEIIVGIRSGLGGFFQAHAADLSITAFGVLGFLLLIFAINKLIWFPLLEWSHRHTEE